MRMGYEIKRADGMTRGLECPFCHNPTTPTKGEGTKCDHCGRPFILPFPYQTNMHWYDLVNKWETETRR